MGRVAVLHVLVAQCTEGEIMTGRNNILAGNLH